MKRTLIFAFLLLGLTLKVGAVDISAKSAILYEANTGEILYEKNINERRPIASTTKIMTALLVIENGDLNDIVEIKKEQVGVEGTSLHLKEGERISVKTLLYGLMLKSGNDAAEALAVYIAGDIEKFILMMNEKAQSLDMKDTNFGNPHGLPLGNHYSTAYDMARLSAYAMKNSVFREIVSAKNYTAEGRSFKNHNKLLSMREEINGVKTGYTKTAGRCLVSAAEKDDMSLVAVTLSAPDDWNDHLKIYDFGFENFKTEVICEKNAYIGKVSIAGYGMVGVKAKNACEITMKSDETIEKQIYLPRFCYAPIENGEKIGELHIKKDGKVTEKIDLVSDKDVTPPRKKGFFERIWDKIKNG